MAKMKIRGRKKRNQTTSFRELNIGEIFTSEDDHKNLYMRLEYGVVNMAGKYEAINAVELTTGRVCYFGDGYAVMRQNATVELTP